MSLIDWFRRTTFQGTIKRELGTIRVPGGGVGGVRVDIQELEPKRGTSSRRFRFNMVAKTPLSYASMPFALGESEVRDLVAILRRALEATDGGTASLPLRP
jgi:hypothetical protein